MLIVVIRSGILLGVILLNVAALTALPIFFKPQLLTRSNWPSWLSSNYRKKSFNYVDNFRLKLLGPKQLNFLQQYATPQASQCKLFVYN